MAIRNPKSEILTIRVSQEQKLRLSKAAERSQMTVSQFVLKTSMTEADQVLVDLPIISLTEADYDAFLARMKEPAPNNPALDALFERASVLEK